VWNEATDDGGLAINLQDLGARVLNAARLATAVHLFESLQQQHAAYRQRVTIGGAGPCVDASADTQNDLSIKEDALSATAGAHKAHQSRRPSQGVGDPFGGPGTPLNGCASTPLSSPEGLSGK
jgi:hypothetical protein